MVEIGGEAFAEVEIADAGRQVAPDMIDVHVAESSAMVSVAGSGGHVGADRLLRPPARGRRGGLDAPARRFEDDAG
jgi:hypothetical protein